MAMTEDDFWKLIDTTRSDDLDEQIEQLVTRLAKRPADDVVDFGHWWHAARDRAYDNRLWAAAYLMNGGCSDDGFTDFRSWLMLQGRAVYEAALRDPDCLADATSADEDGESEFECYPAPDAYEQATGQDHAAFYDAEEQKHGKHKPPTLTGDEFDFDDDEEMRKRLPKLFAKFTGGDGD